MDACPYCGSPVGPNDDVCPSCGSPVRGFGLPAGAALAHDKIRLERALGQGGFGITYAGRSEALGIPVAVKEFFPDGSTRRGLSLVPPTSLLGQGFLETRSRFLEEARLLARFRHPGVVRVYDVFEENNTAYLVMELLEGETLGERLARLGKLEGREVERLALALLGALEAVHATGLLHRDIKPDNVFLTRDSRTVLIDFGSAREFVTSRTVRHTQLVTPGYAAPEQYASHAKFGPYTDLYALSATLYQALTGRAPPTATDRFVGAVVPPLPGDAPDGLRDAITRGLALGVSERPQTVAAYLELVHPRVAARAPDVLPPAPGASRSGRSKPSSPGRPDEPEVERVLYRSADVIITTRFVTVGNQTAPLSRFKRVDLEREFTGSNQTGTFGCLGCLGVLLLLILPPIGAIMIVLSVLGAFLASVARREVHHVVLRNARERWRVFSSLNRKDAEALLNELSKFL